MHPAEPGKAHLPATEFFALLFGLATSAQARELTFEQRVRAQEAIERVDYSHQIGATRPFENAVSRELLERKVRKYLAQSAALQLYRDTPVTVEALQRELERITRQTRFPDRLLELYDALGYDPAGDAWSPMTTVDAPRKRRLHEAVRADRFVILWGGASGNSGLNDGGRYAAVGGDGDSDGEGDVCRESASPQAVRLDPCPRDVPRSLSEYSTGPRLGSGGIRVRRYCSPRPSRPGPRGTAVPAE